LRSPSWAHRDYYRRIRDICDAYDVLFVADEVLCGYGRTGLPFALSAWDVEPDIVTLGKALASGYAPLAAMVLSDRIRDVFAQGTGRFVHGLTYSGNPSSCFIGLKVHEIMQREDLFTRAAAIGKVLGDRLHALTARHEIIGEVRGRGLLLGVEFVADRATRRPFDIELRVAHRVVEEMRRRNVLVTTGIALANFGKNGDHIQISPPFTISEAEVDCLVGALDESLAVVSHEVGAKV
jgi:adenosylmethionine-8-amino-7-oxononanoate aminotransferase